MKATKIIGAVLGVLLVAALFTGAVAAVEKGDLALTVYYYEEIPGDVITAALAGDWISLDGQKISLKEGEDYVVDNASLKEGSYYKAGNKDNQYISLVRVDALVKGFLFENGQKTASFIDAVIGNDKDVVFDWTDNLNADFAIVDGLRFTNPEGTLVHSKKIGDTEVTAAMKDKKFSFTKKVTEGLWTVQAHFNPEMFVSYVPESFLYGTEYYFTVASTDLTATISTEELVIGNYVTLSLTGVPGEKYLVEATNKYMKIADGMDDAGKTSVVAVIGNDGTKSLTFVADKKGTETIKVYKEGGLVTDSTEADFDIEIKAGSVTATASADSVFIGNKVTISGTNDLGDSDVIYLWIKGTNLKVTPLIADPKDAGSGKIWEIKDIVLKEVGGKMLDAGTYTIYAGTLGTHDITMDPTKDDYDGEYATVSLALKQPFITITKAPEVVVQGDDINVYGTAEGKPGKVNYYIFGTNKFVTSSQAVSNGTFHIKVTTSDKEGNDDYLATGQYFLVVQHPMYDKMFNIGAIEEKTGYAVYENTTDNAIGEDDDGKPVVNPNSKKLFTVDLRQTANAAQALCDALDSQNFDDMYVKASFIVAGPTSYIDPVPSQVTKGQVLTISGTTTGHEDDMVLVELLSTAFAAQPKETVGSAAFTSLSTKIGEDGTWSISFDTSNLNADEYTCSVAVGSLGATTSKITIVEGSTPVNPTQTTGPVTPTAQPTAQPTQTPATPGFGALAALAGLGAVAVLLLRRQ